MRTIHFLILQCLFRIPVGKGIRQTLLPFRHILAAEYVKELGIGKISRLNFLNNPKHVPMGYRLIHQHCYIAFACRELRQALEGFICRTSLKQRIEVHFS